MSTRTCYSRRILCWTVFCQLLLLTSALLPPAKWRVVGANPAVPTPSPSRWLAASSDSSPDGVVGTSAEQESDINLERNGKYIDGLLENLTQALDKWILNANSAAQSRVYNVLDMIESQAMDGDQIQRAHRMVKRAGLPVQEKKPNNNKKELGKTDEEKRKQEAEKRRQWEAARTSQVGENVASNAARSALSRRATTNEKPDLFMGQVDSNLDPESMNRIAQDKQDIQSAMDKGDAMPEKSILGPSPEASAKVSDLVARAGAGSAFEGETLGIGGLDEVLAEVKRRVWTPLAAPPQLLQELGIQPVRGLLLYGKPGCGKTLLARKLGQMLSPLRPITVVSGPEIMDKFVGSSEKNLREVFDSPPDIYDIYRLGEQDGGEAVANAALHVVVMDEFDAIARSRGGRGGSGDQGDAGVARDSVVNQLLAKMDGVDPLPVPTMVIGLTNKRSLIDPALLRPGRFEVQIEVPPPNTIEQRVSILKVHTKHMHVAGRLLVRDAPEGSNAARQANDDMPAYEELLLSLADKCEGFSGASLAGVCRAAASHALERAVEEFTQHPEDSSLQRDCVVTEEDFASAVQDVLNGLGDSDWTEKSA